MRTYKYRIYPGKKQQKRFLNQFKICKEVYNTLLAESKKLFVTKQFDLNSLVMDIKLTCPGYYYQVNAQVLQNVSDRLSKAFDNFFRRVKEKNGKAGYPRFKSRIKSITYPQSGFKFKSNKRLYASKIGNIPIVLHRIPKGKIKTMTIKVNKAEQWFAVFCCEVETPTIKHKSSKSVGIDVGLESFATLSNGEHITNPRFLIKAEKRLKLLQRRLSRKKKGSANRKKARFTLARQHLRVANQRTDFLHKLSHKITQSYSFIVVEDLNINGMMKNHHLAKSISDVKWGGFIQMLDYKAVASGGQSVEVNPRGTSCTCSKCGESVDMPLSKRQFLCPKCGFACHRDLNAAINILKIGQDLPESTPVDIEPLQQISSVASSVVEAGTISQTVSSH